MNDFMKMLTSEQRDMINAYIDYYAVNDDSGYGCVERGRADLETVLTPWADAKASGLLPRIFKDKLIITEDIQFQTPDDELYMALDRNSDVHCFEHAYRYWLYHFDGYCCGEQGMSREEYDVVNTALWDLMNHTTIIKNRYNGSTVSIPTPDGHNLVIAKGCKPVKMIGKLNRAFDISERFEAYRIAVSMCLNVATIKGKLCLSIHPLDYMTMSDNECDWESCMSWMNFGSYRQGTVEMMNSPYVIVAYLAAKNNMHICGQQYEWSNKKWRSLYIVHPDFIGNIKGYPYQIPEVDKMIIAKIKQMLALDGFAGEYGDIKKYEYGEFESEHGKVTLRFDTNYMYNDFGSIDHYGCVREDEVKSTDIYINYSGFSECMWCGGDYNDESEDGLACSCCYTESRCDCCGERESHGELMETGDGEWVCEHCLSEYYSLSFDDRMYHRDDDMARVFVLPDEYKPAVEAEELDMRSLDYEVPHIRDHVAGSFSSPRDTYAVERLNRFINDDVEIHFFKYAGFWNSLYIAYVYLSELKPEYQRRILERYGYLDDTIGNDFYEAWSTLRYIWHKDVDGEKWAALLDEKTQN